MTLVQLQLGGFYIWTYSYHLIRSSAAKYKETLAVEESLKEPNKDLEANEKSHLLDGTIEHVTKAPTVSPLLCGVYRHIDFKIGSVIYCKLTLSEISKSLICRLKLRKKQKSGNNCWDYCIRFLKSYWLLQPLLLWVLSNSQIIKCLISSIHYVNSNIAKFSDFWIYIWSSYMAQKPHYWWQCSTQSNSGFN